MRARFRLIRVCHRRRRRVAVTMRRAGHPVHAIALALGLKSASVIAATRHAHGLDRLFKAAKLAGGDHERV